MWFYSEWKFCWKSCGKTHCDRPGTRIYIVYKKVCTFARHMFQNLKNMWSSTRRVDLPKKDGYTFQIFTALELEGPTAVKHASMRATSSLSTDLINFITGMTTLIKIIKIMDRLSLYCKNCDQLWIDKRSQKTWQTWTLKNSRPFWEVLDHFRSTYVVCSELSRHWGWSLKAFERV
jgi:hypothetical protein